MAKSTQPSFAACVAEILIGRSTHRLDGLLKHFPGFLRALFGHQQFGILGMHSRAGDRQHHRNGQQSGGIRHILGIIWV